MDAETDRHLNTEDNNPDYSLQNLLPRRKRPPSIKSDVVYIEVKKSVEYDEYETIIILFVTLFSV